MMLASLTPAAAEGTQSGGGGGTIARLLTYAKAHLGNNLPLLTPAAMQFEEPELNTWYAKNHDKFSDAVAKIRLIPVAGSDPLIDQHFGNTTWIRVGVESDYDVEFKLDLDLYQKITGSQPSLETVIEYLVHELGHMFDLGEVESWSFARQVVAKFQFQKKLSPKHCKLVAPDSTKDSGHTDRDIIVKPDILERLSIDDLQYEFNLNSARFDFEASVKDSRGWTLFHLVVMANDNPASWVMIKPDAFFGLYCTP
jgi:hypothetical protein